MLIFFHMLETDNLCKKNKVGMNYVLLYPSYTADVDIIIRKMTRHHRAFGWTIIASYCYFTADSRCLMFFNKICETRNGLSASLGVCYVLLNLARRIYSCYAKYEVYLILIYLSLSVQLILLYKKSKISENQRCVRLN